MYSSYQEIKHELLLNMINLEAAELTQLPTGNQRWEFTNSQYLAQLEGKEISIHEDNKLVYKE